MRSLIAFATAALFLVGCLQAPEVPPPDPAPGSFGPPAPGAATESPTNPTTEPAASRGPATTIVGDGYTASIIEVAAEGGAGEWWIGYWPLEQSVKDPTFGVEYNFSMAGGDEGAVALLAGPGPANLGAAREFFPPFEKPRISMALPGDTYEEHTSGVWGLASTNTFEGMFFAVAASHPWSFTLRFEVRRDQNGHNESFAPWARTDRGTGSDFHLSKGPLPLGVGEHHVEASWDRPGWVHVQPVGDVIQPESIQTWNVTLPAGDRFAGQGVQGGYEAADGSSWTTVAYADAFGDVHAPAGSAEATFQMARTSHATRLAIAHVPTSFFQDWVGDGLYSHA